MNWIDRLLMRIVNFFVIENAEGDPYLCRYRLVHLPFFRIYVHHILRSDEDQELHDHPWNFVSVILWQGYIEVCGMREFPGTPDWPQIRRAGHVVRHRATDAHRLVLERPAWTLVFATGKKRTWGFYDLFGRWVTYSDFFDRKYGKGQWVTG